jgi:hypothetical protein
MNPPDKRAGRPETWRGRRDGRKQKETRFDGKRCAVRPRRQVFNASYTRETEPVGIEA